MALRWWILVVGGLCIVAGVLVFVFFPSPAIAPAPEDKSNLIRVSTPLPNSVIHSPITVFGIARGYWFFEASFPVEVQDRNGAVLGVGIAQAQSEWMTEEFVPFEATVTFATSTTPGGVIVFKKDNPSGLREHDDALEIPIEFE